MPIAEYLTYGDSGRNHIDGFEVDWLPNDLISGARKTLFIHGEMLIRYTDQSQT